MVDRRLWRSFGIALVWVIFLAPLVLMVIGSWRATGLPPADGFDIVPEAVSWANYGLVNTFVPLGRQLANSLAVSVSATAVTVLVASWAGYTIATARPRLRRWLIGVSLVALMVPATALWVPRFVMFRWAGLIDTWVPLIAPALMATTPFYVLLFALAYSRIPATLIEAARVEGAKPFQVWWRVAWPLGRATAFAVTVLAFIAHWSNFIDPLLYLSSAERFTLPLGLRALQSLEPTNHPILLAAAVVAAVPPIVAFILGQRALFERTIDA